jgi:hypothetical protein
MACVRYLTKETWFSKILLKKTDISMISFQQLDFNGYDPWNLQVDSRTRKTFKRKDHWLSLQSNWQKWH